MLSRRPFRKPLRLVVPAVLVGAVVLVPGVASADPSNPVAPVTGTAQQVLDQASSAQPGSTGDGSTGGTSPIPDLEPPAGLPGLPGDTGAPDPATGLTPDALRQLFIQALGPLGISADCVNGVFDGFQNVVTAVTDQKPEDLQNLLATLVGALQNGGQGFDPSSLSDNEVAKALQDLATTLQTTCMPATPPPAQGSHTTPPPAASLPVVPAAQPAAPAAAAPVAQPASYSGYAPTGGTPADSSSPVPLAVLGGVVLLGGAGAAGYRTTTRGARSRG